MLTTLTSRVLADTTLSYTFSDGILKIIIDTLANHNVLGDVKIAITGAESKNAYSDQETLVPDIFNKTYTFSNVTDKRLQTSIKIKNGFNLSNDLVDISGTPVATIDNVDFTIDKGLYLFRIFDPVAYPASNFDGSEIHIQEQNIGNSGQLGVIDKFDELGLASLESIDNQELTFQNPTKIFLGGTIGGSTNIPILVETFRRDVF